jgi:hypothetical protein
MHAHAHMRVYAWFSLLEWVKSFGSIHQELTVKGFKPKLQILDNEASTALKNFFTVNDIAYQLVPPHCHRRKRCGTRHQDFRRTLCGRYLLS